ncbi:MogA/MoaB family molybdenum cofactor biosynthesis protein [bacterium]|nr:MogA/MoaB family molybdenum cofactor biosynthesis protein [bacterium]MDY3022924.1 MogA/MoaB family molybdenum cofactor biosynthesis protein [Oliverpabstia sp.]
MSIVNKRVAIIVSSDSGYRGEREDLSGPEIRRIVEKNGYQVVSTVILPDEQEVLSEEMKRIADENQADLILTTGGTGFSPRDCMPEATLAVAERLVPGIPEAMRTFSMQFTKRSMLSRSAAGIRKKTLIINLPGSPKAVRECLEYIISELAHGLDILTGEASNCARK